MDFSIGRKNLKIFSKALRFMARYSFELFVEAQADKLIIRATNPVQTTVIISVFEVEFFVRYVPAQDPEGNSIKISFRPLLNALKNIQMIAGSHFLLDMDKDKLAVVIKKESGCDVTHRINLMENEELSEVNMDMDNASEVCCHPSVYLRLQSSLKPTADINMQFSERKLMVQNFIEAGSKDTAAMRLNYTIASSEFSRFEVLNEASLVFSSADFFTFIDLAQQLNCDIRMQFHKSGEPISVICDTGTTYHIQMIEVTMTDAIIEKKRKNAKLVSYKEVVHDKHAERTTNSELDLMADPAIGQTNNSQTSARTSQAGSKRRNLSEDDMDEMLKAVQSAKTKRARREVEIPTINLSQQELDEVNSVLRHIFDDNEDENQPPQISGKSNDNEIEARTISNNECEQLQSIASNERENSPIEIDEEILRENLMYKRINRRFKPSKFYKIPVDYCSGTDDDDSFVG